VEWCDQSEDAESHPQRHILTAALGAGTEVSPDTPEQPIELQKGDKLLLWHRRPLGLISDSELQKQLAPVPLWKLVAPCCRWRKIVAAPTTYSPNTTLQ